MNNEYLRGMGADEFFWLLIFLFLENPKDFMLVKQLLEHIKAHIVVLERGLTVHRQICGPAVLPLQELLEGLFCYFILIYFRLTVAAEQFVKTKTNVDVLEMPSNK